MFFHVYKQKYSKALILANSDILAAITTAFNIMQSVYKYRYITILLLILVHAIIKCLCSEKDYAALRALQICLWITPRTVEQMKCRIKKKKIAWHTHKACAENNHALGKARKKKGDKVEKMIIWPYKLALEHHTTEQRVVAHVMLEPLIRYAWRSLHWHHVTLGHSTDPDSTPPMSVPHLPALHKAIVCSGTRYLHHWLHVINSFYIMSLQIKYTADALYFCIKLESSLYD